jgi:uncharacterized membrane protein
MTAAAVCKLAHVVGLALWAGYIPCENVLFFVAWDSRVIEQRRRAMRWVVRLTWQQEVPGILLVALSGIAMLSQQASGLGREPWFQAKLAFLAVLATSELLVTHHLQSDLARRFESAGGQIDEPGIRRTLRAIVTGGLTSLAALFGIVVVTVGQEVPPPVVWLLVPGALATGGVLLVALRRIAVGIRDVLPDV